MNSTVSQGGETEHPDARSGRTTDRLSSRRRILFRCAAVALGLVPLMVLEILFVALDWGRASDQEDPFVGFSDVVPLFELDESKERYRIAESRRTYFAPDSFAASKDEREFRVFCLGGSTVQGRPYSIETSFPTWLEINLRAADPGRRWKVVNCGGVSYASYRLLPIMKEVLNHDPDLIVLYTGHNEFLEDRTYGHLRRVPEFVFRAQQAASNLRTYNLLRRGWSRVNDGRRDERPELPAEVDAILDYQDGLKAYRRDDARRDEIIAHYEYNLRRMIELARERDVPVWLVNPACDLRGTPPFKSQHRAGLTADERRRFDELWRGARSLPAESADEARKSIDEMLRIDDRHAGAHYHRAVLLDRAGRFQEARAAYLRAKEEDVCPLRMLEPMHRALRRVAEEENVPLVDVESLFREASPDGIPGDNLFLDHVHPTFRGHQMIAEAILEEMRRRDLARQAPDFVSTRNQLYNDQFARLPLSYFERGKQRLRGLQRWTQGRAKKVRPAGSPQP